MQNLRLRIMRYPYSTELLVLVLSSLAAVSIFGYRVSMGTGYHFLFLLWNLFLAWIPYLVSSYLVWRQPKSRSVWIGGFLLWLIFLPNAPYIITDLFHLRPKTGVPYWLDLMILISFAWTGLILGLASLRHLHIHLFNQLGKWWGWLITACLLLLSGFGVYLGRFERWNSWDLFTDPTAIFKEISQLLLQLDNKAIGFSLVFWMFLTIAYLSFAHQLRRA